MFSTNRTVPLGDLQQIVFSRRRITPYIREKAFTHPDADHDDSSHCLVETSHGTLRVVEEGSRALAGQMAAVLVNRLSLMGRAVACRDEFR